MTAEVSVSTLSSLHTHCNNKIAGFRSGVIADHRDWLSTVIADARSTLLKSSKDEPISILPPRTPHAPRKRRCVEERPSSGVAECVPIRSPAGDKLVTSASSPSSSASGSALSPRTPPPPMSMERHTAAVLGTGKRNRAVAETNQKRCDSGSGGKTATSSTMSSHGATVKFAAQPVAAETTTVPETTKAAASSGRSLRSRRSSPKAEKTTGSKTSGNTKTNGDSVVGGTTTGKATSAATSPRRNSPPVVVSPVLRVTSPKHDDAGSDATSEQAMDMGKESPERVPSLLTSESVQALELETGTYHEQPSHDDGVDDASFVTAKSELKTADKEEDTAPLLSPSPTRAEAGGTEMTENALSSPPPLQSMPPPAFGEKLSEKESKEVTPRAACKTLSSQSTPVVSLTPMENRSTVRSYSSASNSSRVTRSSMRSHQSAVVAALASGPVLPSCYGVHMFDKMPYSPGSSGTAVPSAKQMKETPVAARETPTDYGTSYVPPSATRILRSALRKHGAEADNDVHMKFKSGAEASSAILRFGGPVRPGQSSNESPANSDNEADDDHPKVLKRLGNIVSSVTSLIPHNKTPKKLDTKAKQDKLKADLEAKQKIMEERKRRKEEQRVQELEEKKQKRAERERLNRKRKADMEVERNAKLLKKTASDAPCSASAPSSTAIAANIASNTTVVMSAAQKKKAQQEQDEQRRKEQRRLEAETRRRHEEELKAKKRNDQLAAAAATTTKKTGGASAAVVSALASSSSSSVRSVGLHSPRLAMKSRLITSTTQPSSLATSSGSSSALSHARPVAESSSSGNARCVVTPSLNAPPHSASSGSGGSASSNILRKALSRTNMTSTSSSATAAPSASTAASSLSKVQAAAAEKKTPPMAKSTPKDVASSTATATAPGFARPPTPSCANLVRSFPASSGSAPGKPALSKTAGVTSSTSSSVSYMTSSKPAVPAASLQAIPEVTSAKTAVATSSSVPMPRSPLKTLNKTYTMPASTSSSNSSLASTSKKVTISPMPKSRTGSQIDVAYNSKNIVPVTPKASTSYNNYDIDDMESDDPTDDEESPRRKIPKWAQQGPLKRALIDQEISGDIADQLFPVTDLETPNLTRIFQRERQRYLKRTSSAIWSSPLVKRA
eukprot:scpid22883/ scgid18752/ 